ncbi:MAG TPA: tRNA pseudouridine(55) synthase TruB [Gemmatimonadales bacterium]|nr:tRNA pseudouridine(55) synthase TruB [Gemmatimonadales bacterium]
MVDKPEGPTSHDVVARARRLFRTRAVGHTGTLDPFATGLLILVFGGATRLARWAQRHRKTYRADVRLGVVTDTDDRTGRVTQERHPESWPDREQVEAALRELAGVQSQRPPAFSAKRIEGERSHRVARRGGAPVPAPVEVTVFSIELLDYAPPMLSFRAEVSPGTYIRALGRDLGERLGIGAHVAELRREKIGPWRVDQARPLAGLDGSEPLLPPRSLVDDLAAVSLDAEEIIAVGHGRTIRRDGVSEGEAALLDGQRLVAVARAAPGGWHPVVVLA